MKICAVFLLGTLGMSAEARLVAQALPANTVMVASESMPGGADAFPGLLGGSHTSLLQPLTPATAAGPTAPEAAAIPRLTPKDRFTLFLNDTYASPGAYAGLSAGAVVDQVMHAPLKWDEDGSGYTRRFASGFGQLAVRNVIHEGLAGVTGLDPRYQKCGCNGVLHRTAHAVEMSLTTYREDGRLTLDLPQIAGAYGSGMVSTYWYPHRLYNPLVQGVQFGHEQMGQIALSNLVQEFAPDIKRTLHLHALAAHVHALPLEADD